MRALQGALWEFGCFWTGTPPKVGAFQPLFGLRQDVFFKVGIALIPDLAEGDLCRLANILL